MLKSPVEFVKDIKPGRHLVLFYENAEYARSICFAFLKAGLESYEHSFYITAKEDKDFFKNEFIEKMYGPNITYEYNTSPNATFNENLFHGQNIPSLSHKQDNQMVDSINKEIINIVNNNNHGKLINNTETKNDQPNIARLVFRCLHTVDTEEQIQNNIKWEKNFRNIKLREELPYTSLVCTYSVENVIETLKGNLKMYSNWMTELLEMYDGVIFARNNWTGAAFNFV